MNIAPQPSPLNDALIEQSLDGVEGWLAPEDAMWLARFVYRAATTAADPLVVEIGSWKGRSTIAMALALRRSGRGRLFAIDPHLGEPTAPSDTMPEFLSNLRRAGVIDVVEPIRSFSREPIDRFADASVSFLFLDGSHDYKEVVRDIDAWAPKLTEDAVIAFDDADWGGVNRALVERVTGAGSIFRNPRYLGKILYCRVKRTQPWGFADAIAALRLRALLAALLIGARVAPRTHWRVLHLSRAALRAITNVPMGELPKRLAMLLLCTELQATIDALT